MSTRLFHTANKAIRKRWLVLESTYRRMPDFLIIGAQKGGTTTLFDQLAQHPSLDLPETKEIRYFDRKFDKGEVWYRGFFPYKVSGKKTGEATPYYLVHPLASKRIAKAIPNVKMIVLLRDPVSRAFSHYQMIAKRGQEPYASFEEAVDHEEERLKGELERIVGEKGYYSHLHNRHSYLTRGLYGRQLERWFNLFPREQFLVLKSESYFSDPQATLDTVCDFLQVKKFKLDTLAVSNKGKYSQKPDERVVEKLRAYYKEDIKKLQALAGPEFKWW